MICITFQKNESVCFFLMITIMYRGDLTTLIQDIKGKTWLWYGNHVAKVSALKAKRIWSSNSSDDLYQILGDDDTLYSVMLRDERLDERKIDDIYQTKLGCSKNELIREVYLTRGIFAIRSTNKVLIFRDSFSVHTIPNIEKIITGHNCILIIADRIHCMTNSKNIVFDKLGGEILGASYQNDVLVVGVKGVGIYYISNVAKCCKLPIKSMHWESQEHTNLVFLTDQLIWILKGNDKPFCYKWVMEASNCAIQGDSIAFIRKNKVILAHGFEEAPTESKIPNQIKLIEFRRDELAIVDDKGQIWTCNDGNKGFVKVFPKIKVKV